MARIRALARRTIRETRVTVEGKPLQVSLEPGDLIGLKRRGDRTWHYVGIADLWNTLLAKEQAPNLADQDPVEVRRIERLVENVLETVQRPLNIRQLEAGIRHSRNRTPNMEGLRAVLKVMQQQGNVAYVHPLKYTLTRKDRDGSTKTRSRTSAKDRGHEARKNHHKPG